MSDRSLFPDRFPDKEPKRKPEWATNCCADLVTPRHVNLRTWRLLHQIGHNRSTIAVKTLAALADVSTDEAHRAIQLAVNEAWLVPARRERATGPALWAGVLSRRP